MTILCAVCEAIMKLYSLYTPSHSSLKQNWLVDSLQDDFDLVIEAYQQKCPDGSIVNKAFNETMQDKVSLIIRAIIENWHGVFLYSDVDVQFFRKTKSLLLRFLGTRDAVFQRDSPWGAVCAGFFACRANERTLQLWKTIRSHLDVRASFHDQDVLNYVLNGVST